MNVATEFAVWMENEELYNSDTIQDSKYKIFAWVGQAFMQPPEHIGDLSQEATDYDRINSIGKTIHDAWGDLGLDEHNKHTARWTYCGSGKATMSKRDKMLLQLGDSSCKILESLDGT